MFAVTVHFQIRPDAVPAFQAAMRLNATASVADEPGCHRFDICAEPDTPDRIFLYELYDDEAAFKAHMQTPHYARLNTQIEGMVLDKDVRTFSEVWP